MDEIDLLGIDRVLRRGTGEVIEKDDTVIFAYDSVSEAYFLACEDAEAGLAALEKHVERDMRLLSVIHAELGKTVFEKYGFTDMFECYQVAYYGEPPAVREELEIRIAGREDIPMLVKNYDLISPEEMERVVERKSMMLGYKDGQLIGFIGEHLEGSMGLLYVFPEFRRMGYASVLEKRYIADTMRKGFIPFGQVEIHNAASLKLQKKVGMTQSRNTICWMWK